MYAYTPISYINQPLDLSTSGTIQQYKFRNIAVGYHVIAAKLISESSRFSPSYGEFETSVYDSSGNMLKNFVTECTSNGTCWNIYIMHGWSKGDRTEYYQFGELSLDRVDNYTLEVKTIKEIPTEAIIDTVKIGHEKREYEIGIYPLEYNKKLQGRRRYRETLLKTSPAIISALALITIYLVGFISRGISGRRLKRK
ncbi:MAG: hypothetical protein MJA29_06705 [Candidatus Omnitrophica bacterium]|nr:hypothetical protein [Candidatus Omnitrophota bacterium]